jgi:hypothetical protein
MTPERERTVILTLCICSAMLLCAVLSAFHTPYRKFFNVGFCILMILNSWLTYRYSLKRRQPDTLIHLFPANTETSQERS